MKLWKCKIGWRAHGTMGTETATVYVAADDRITARTTARQQWELVKPEGAAYLWMLAEEETQQLTLL